MGGKIGKQFTAIQIKEMVKSGTTVKQIAEEANVSETAVYNFLAYHNVKLRDDNIEERAGADRNQINSIRRAKGITQAELGNKMGISQQSVANHEKRRRKVTASYKIKYAEALDSTIEELFPDTNS